MPATGHVSMSLWTRETTPVQIRAQAAGERESIIEPALDKTHRRHVSPLGARQRGQQRLRDEPTAGDDAGAVGGGAAAGPVPWMIEADGSAWRGSAPRCRRGGPGGHTTRTQL